MLRVDSAGFAQQRIVYASQTPCPGEIPWALRARGAIVRPTRPIADRRCARSLMESKHELPHCPSILPSLDAQRLSARLIESHYEHNYGGAVARLNAISRELQTLDPKTASAETIGRLKRDEMAALNSTLLHELYFASLGGDGRAVPEPMASVLAKDFGSVDRWRQEFVALAGALSGGSGWMLLSHVPCDGRLSITLAWITLKASPAVSRSSRWTCMSTPIT
jgi:superoxide dismutase